MGYRKATDVLPPDVLEKLQDYIDGEYLYIPRKQENRKTWGEDTDTKKVFSERNIQIYADYLAGMSLHQLATNIFLWKKVFKELLGNSGKNSNKRCAI